jgi:hypothetical protein
MSNQQERLEIEQWIVGFTDGEGCFSVSMFRNKTTALGWQVFPEFVITQGKKSLPALKIFQEHFGCGKIYENKRYDNHKESLYRYCVRSLDDLQRTVIPFFRTHQLRTAKKRDFELFESIVGMILKKEHLTTDGMQSIASKIECMNNKKKSRFLESSETTRRAPQSEKIG